MPGWQSQSPTQVRTGERSIQFIDQLRASSRLQNGITLM